MFFRVAYDSGWRAVVVPPPAAMHSTVVGDISDLDRTWERWTGKETFIFTGCRGGTVLMWILFLGIVDVSEVLTVSIFNANHYPLSPLDTGIQVGGNYPRAVCEVMWSGARHLPFWRSIFLCYGSPRFQCIFCSPKWGSPQII
jgi:hypothetical protein